MGASPGDVRREPSGGRLDAPGARRWRSDRPSSLDGAVLVGLRVYLGIIFLLAVKPKLAAEPDFTPRLLGFLNNVALTQGHGFYRAFIEDIVIPHAAGFTTLLVAGELTVGLLLLFGAATRLAAAITIFLLFNYMFAKGMWPWTPASNDWALIMIALAVLVTRAGRILGLDARLARRWPGVPLW
jgi:uncharacterized membrane protein YphA (DoxX/SURF4 family)